jgi:hypothetical protein
MEENPLLPLPEGMQIDQIQVSENEVSITVIARTPGLSVPCAATHRAPFIADIVERCEMPLVVVAVFSLSCACANSSAAIRGCRAQGLYRTTARASPSLGTDNDPLFPATHLHRTGRLRQRRNPLSSAFRDTDLAANDPALYHGSPRSSYRFRPLPWNRRFFVPAWLPVRHDSRGSRGPSCC